MAKSCFVPQFIYIHSQEGNIPEFSPDGINLNFKLLPLYANMSREYSRRYFPADIKSVTSLLVPFLKQFQFSNKNQAKIEYERGVFQDNAVRRFKEALKTEGEARGFQHYPADIKSVTSLLVPILEQKSV